MDGVDLGVVCQVAADVGATIKQAKPAPRDELTEDVFVERSEVVVDRVHFHCAYIAPDVQLVNDVQRCDGAEVARAQDQAHLGVTGVGPAVQRGRLRARLFGADAGLNPDFAPYSR